MVIEGLPRWSLVGQFVFTCVMLMFLCCGRRTSGVLSLEPPSFKIEDKVVLKARLSCGIGMFQHKQDSMTHCASANEGEPNRTTGLQSEDCSACDPLNNARFSIDSVLGAGAKSKWRSLPKTNDSTLQEINITISFPQVFKVQSISIKAGSTPLPAAWGLETSRAIGNDFEAVRYYTADQEDDRDFTIYVNVLVSSVRLRFLKMRSSFEATDSDSDYYSISEISIEGKCMCNGHAEECTQTESGLMACHCQDNTCGEQCQSCCDGYVLKDGVCVGVPASNSSTDEPLAQSMSSLSSADKKNISATNNTESTLVKTTNNPSQLTENVHNLTKSSEEISGETTLDSGDKQSTVEPATTQTTPASTPKGNESQASAFGSTGEPSTTHTTTGHSGGQPTVDSYSPVTTATPTTQINTTTTVNKMDPESTTVKTTSGTTDRQVASKLGSSDTTTWKHTAASQTSTESDTAGMPTTTVLSASLTSTVELLSSTTYKDLNNATTTQSSDSEATLPTDVQSTVASTSHTTTVDTTTGDFTTTETTVEHTNGEDTEIYTTVETFPESTTVESTTVLAPEESTVVETHEGSITDPASEETTSDCTSDESSGVPTPEDFTLPTPEESSVVSKPDETTAVADPEESTSVMTSEEDFTTSTREESTSVPTPEDSSTVSTSGKSTAEPTPEKNTTISTPESTRKSTEKSTAFVGSTPTTVPTPDENTGVTTTERSTTVAISRETTTVTTPETSTTSENSTLSLLGRITTVCTPEKSSGVLTPTENTTVPTSKKGFTVSTPVKSTTVPTLEKSSTVPPPVGNTTTVPDKQKNTTVPTQVKRFPLSTQEESTITSTQTKSTPAPATEENTTKPTLEKSTTLVTLEDSTTGSISAGSSTITNTNTTGSSTEKTTTASMSRGTTTISTPVETTKVSTAVETTKVSTPVDTTKVSTPVDTTKVSTAVETTKVLTPRKRSDVKSTTGLTPEESTTALTTAETTTVPTTVNMTTVRTTDRTTTVPTTVKTTTVPTTKKTTTVPTTVKTTTVPTTKKTNTVPTTERTTTMPTTVKTTTMPTTKKTTTVPTTERTTTVPTTVKTTTMPTTVPTTKKTTLSPTTSGVLSEEEARKVFGDLPLGVCYCSKFATVDKQCFPTALNKPCICRANFAGTRCEKCAPGYFNYPFCASCRCNKEGSAKLTCDEETGSCTCKTGVRGRKCDTCPYGSYGFPNCQPCECNPSGSYRGGRFCDPYSGQCPCRYGVRGRQCNKCPAGYYGFPNCQWCGCNPLTTTADICADYRGSYRCLCKGNFQGFFCGQCRPGYFGFPVCQKCLCSPSGYGSCNQLGKCVCNEGYAGIQCDRCANGYYGFPYCRACNCNSFGSYSSQCNYTTGKCHCRPNIRGSHCDRCDEGMVGFPTCVKCDCNPDGSRFLPGLGNNVCYGSSKYQCLCKSNVVGRTCDRCMHGFYNFSGSNPSGCSSCGCSPRGTVSGTRNCHVQTGRCVCKNHVMGKKCQNCQDGYHGMRSQEIFGCKACKCDPGGSVSRNCFKHFGDCQCVSGVKGRKCDSLYSSRAIYFPTLYHIFAELEGAVLMSNTRNRVPIGADEDVFPNFSGIGYAMFPAYKEYGVAVYIPKTRKYHMIFHYALRDNLRTTAKVNLHPRGSKITSINFDVKFSPASDQQSKNLRTTVNSRGVNREFQLEKGVWNVIITSHSSMLLLDYIVFLPEDYYNAGLLKGVPPGPCMLRTSRPEYCDMYTYYELKSPSVVTMSGGLAYTHPLKGLADIFTDPRYNLDESHLASMALLGRNQPTIGFDITVPESGPYVLMVTYLHPERFIQRVFATVGYQRGMLEILPCKYQFACRQFAMDDNKRPKAFELKAAPEVNEVKIESSASAKIAVSSVTFIPQAKWNTQYVKPELLCRMFNKSCISSTYPIPADSIQLAAFSRRSKDRMFTLFNDAVNASASYYIIMHYRQPQSLSKKVEQLSITYYERLNISVTFHYCPTDHGCRVVIGEEENLTFRFSKGTFTAIIQHERRTHLSYILLVPKASYSTSLLELESNGRVNQFLQNCGKDHFYLDTTRGRQCREDVFSLTIRFNGEPLKCSCNVLGSRSGACDEFGGQCLCRTDVVGRKCDRCKLGHSGFPRCRRCGCHEIGSLSTTCSSNGRCRCKPGFGGYKCDRCASSSYYGFPDCKLCACSNLGSLSTFCRSRDGQCQCRRNFQGQKCNECRIGFYDFPSCKACNCNPAGIKLLPGQTNGCGSVNNTHCRCKDNVIGGDCDSCKTFHFNLQINNPLGCQTCDCNTNGTLGTIKTCHESSGQCLCKSHVTGRQCERCKDGYYSLKSQNVFGCKRCSCNAGGSVSQSCNAITGECSCLVGVGGSQCDRVVSGDYFYPTLHQYKIELEDTLTSLNDQPAYFRYDESEFPGFSWRGYAVFSQAQDSIYVLIDIPRTSKYELIFHYLLARYAPVKALVKFIPTLDSATFPSGPATEQTLDVRFRTTATWIFAIAQFLVVRDNWGDTQQVLLSQGKWKLLIYAPASDLLLDYMVLLPEEYYKPQNLEVQVSVPCELRGDQRHCAHFAYPNLKQDGFVTIQTEDSSVVGGIKRTTRVTDIPFQGLILSGAQSQVDPENMSNAPVSVLTHLEVYQNVPLQANVMSVRLPSKIRGQFVLLASYFHNVDNGGILTVVVRTSFSTRKGHMTILSCRYRFGCREVAIDEEHQVLVFTANENDVTTISLTTTLTIAVDFITAIPVTKWKAQFLIPAEQCISNGHSCIQSAYPFPTDAVRIEAEDRFKGGDRAPYYIMDRRASLKHLKVGEKTVHVSGSASTGRYYVIVHFYQPNFLSFLGKVVVSGQNAASTLLTFRYCPHVSGCRAVGTSQYREGMSESIYIGRQKNILVSIAIPEDKGVWIDYVLLIPISSYSPSLLEVKPIDVTQDFIQDCGQYTFFLKDSSSKFCLQSAFAITTRFNSGAIKCNCDGLGSTKTSCQSFGGQCVCRPNVIGRACDRCKSGYGRFPYCRKLAT